MQLQIFLVLSQPRTLGLILLMVTGTWWASGSLPRTLLALLPAWGWLVWWLMHTRPSPGPSPEPSAPSTQGGESAPAPNHPLHQAGTAILPVWARQTEAARQQMEAGISTLTRDFAGMQRELRSILGDSTFSEADRLEAILESGRATLTRLFQTLEADQTARAALVSHIEDLNATMSNLSEMSAEVAAIANQTNLLALNAAIEAAHAREHGKGFAIVAEEVRKLSERSGATGARISEQVDAMRHALTSNLQMAQEFADRDARSIQQVEITIRKAVDDIGDAATSLHRTSNRLVATSQHVDQQIAGALVAFQFQDRVSQMLGAVVTDIHKLEEHLANAASEIEASRWLNELASTYTTQEQHHIHHGASGTEAVGAGDITFF